MTERAVRQGRPAGFSADFRGSKSPSPGSCQKTQEFEVIHFVLSHLRNPDQIQIYLLLIIVEFVHLILCQRLFFFILCVELYFSYDSMTSDTVE